MRDEYDLPQDVIAAIASNRKIDAIKLLRKARGLGLKEAKDAVEAFAGSDFVISGQTRVAQGLESSQTVDRSQRNSSNAKTVIVLSLIALAIGYVLFQQFFQP